MRPSDSGKGPWTRRTIEREAAHWLALREARAWTTAEHASFSDWRSRSAAHAAIFEEIENAWRQFDALSAYPHSADRASDPDILIEDRPFRPPVLRRSWAMGVLAASVAVAAIFWIGNRDRESSPGAEVALKTERLVRLSDGSVVELNVGAVLEENFDARVRRVVLRGGEAHFSVARNLERPFVVEVGSATVRAIGTAFNIRMDAARLEVLVTEGKVEVDLDPSAGSATRPSSGGGDAHLDTSRAPFPLSAGQRTILEVEPESGRVGTVVVDTPAVPDIDRMLAWQTGRLHFDATPLREAAGQFNARSGGPRLVLGDETVGEVLVSGRIRAENVDQFVEVLVSGFGVEAEWRNAGEIILRRPR